MLFISIEEKKPPVIGRYEHDEMIPSIEAAKNIAKLLNTPVGYLLGERRNKLIYLATLICLKDLMILLTYLIWIKAIFFTP